MKARDESANMDRIKSLIEKLQRLSKSSNVHEAELAASRMSDILLKYNLSLSDIEQKEDDIEREAHALGGSSCEQLWRGALHAAIARYNFCRSIRVQTTFKNFVLGKRHNLAVVAYMYDYLSKTIWRLAKEAAKKEFGKDLGGRYSFLNSFAEGAVAAIEARLKADREKAVKANAESRSLVVVQDALVQKKYDEDLGKKEKNIRNSGNRDLSGYVQGVAAGGRIGLHQGVEQRDKAKEVR